MNTRNLQSLIFEDGIHDWVKVVVIMFFVCDLVLINYSIAKAVNIYRACVSTRFFTDKPKEGGLVVAGAEPVVTIQICAYNEASVIEETINAACSVNWPSDKLFVQVLDDSSDRTSEIIDDVALRWREKGINCNRLTRRNRVGYKAGALFTNTKNIRGDFVALFDADHRCEAQFLRRTVPHFYDHEGNSKDEIGLVQVPWAYYNLHSNWLTEYDGLNLDVSHVIEQQGRSSALQCFGFNGTGGIWRVAAVKAGGGWQWDTITEDLDLSYLAHINGFKFLYLRDIPQQLELPTDYFSHKQQKHRWTKGFMQVCRKSLWQIIKNPASPIGVKYEAFFHMTGATSYLASFMVVFLVPILYLENAVNTVIIGATLIPNISPLLALVITVYCKTPGSNGDYASFWSRTKRLGFVPLVLIYSLGIMLYEIRAMFDGLTSNDATFLRTPKEGKEGLQEDEEEVEDVDNTIELQVDEGVILAGAHDASSSIGKVSPSSAKKKMKKKVNLAKEIMFCAFGIIVACMLVTIPVVKFNSYLRGDGNLLGTTSIFFVLPAIGLLIFHGAILKKILGQQLKKHAQKREAVAQEAKS